MVDDQAVGVGQDLLERVFELRMDGGDRLPVVLAVGVVVVGVHAHRAGAVQREHCNDVAESRGLHTLEELTHRPAVELEHPEGVSPGEQLVGLGIIQRQRIQVEIHVAVELEVVDRVADDREVAQPQEVHLQQADGLTRGVVPAGDDGAVLRALPHRDRLGQRLGRHDHRAGVHTGVADQPFEPQCGVVDLLDIGIGLDELADLAGLFVPIVRGIGDARDRDVLGHDGRRQRLGDAVGDGVSGLTELDAGGVLDRGLGLDGSERDDLGDLVATPPLGGVTHHVAAAAVVEVDVDIGHRHTLGVEESLEEQPVRDRVDVGDAQRPGHQRTGGRTTTGPHPDADLVGVPDEVPDHQEVRGKAHLDDDVQLVVRSL